MGNSDLCHKKSVKLKEISFTLLYIHNRIISKKQRKLQPKLAL
jgi:hypothetical protein